MEELVRSGEEKNLVRSRKDKTIQEQGREELFRNREGKRGRNRQE